eukprot:scaffold5772_cov55-Cyclotella_meneghiniana.AAC.1
MTAGQLPPGWSLMGNGGGQCIDSKGNQYTLTLVGANQNNLGCIAGGTENEDLATLCECMAKASNQTSLLRGAFRRVPGPDFFCVHEPSPPWDCNAFPSAYCAQTGTGTGTIANVDSSETLGSECLVFAGPTHAPTKAPPTTSSPSKAPVTSSPTKAPVTSSPSKAQVTSSPAKAPVTSSPSKAPITKAPQTAFPTVIQGGNPGACAGSSCSSLADCAANGCDASFHCVDAKCMKIDSKSSKGTKATKGPSAKSIKSSKLF